MTKTNIYQEGLDQNPANHVALTPLSYLTRAAQVHGTLPATIYNGVTRDWRETYERCRALAAALADLGVERGDTVSTMLPNTPAMFEAHFGVPMLGAVLGTINIRLDAPTVAFIIDHSETKVILVDPEFSKVVGEALKHLKGPRPAVIFVEDEAYEPGWLAGETTYESLVAKPRPDFHWTPPADEWDAIALGYTSGTTGDPKGVVTHHRGAYLNAVSNVLSWNLTGGAVYLWTLPMFHCNGWCFPWTLAALAGTSVCLRKVDPVLIFDLIATHGVTHYCGAPIVHEMMAELPAEKRAPLPHRVKGMVAGAPPPEATFRRMEQIGVDLTHVYGLTETYGPSAVCTPQEAWRAEAESERLRLVARQGVRAHMQEEVAVLDPDTLQPVPHDGVTIGEVMFRGNIVMKGYLKNPSATKEAFAGGWFHSGDLAVVEPDGYLKIRDRSKDVIISGGENISSLELEEVILKHPAVRSVAVVAMPDEKWGETPAAFVEIGGDLTEAELIAYCREHLARFKVPKKIVFGPLTRNATGKIQKAVLRKQIKDLIQTS